MTFDILLITLSYAYCTPTQQTLPCTPLSNSHRSHCCLSLPSQISQDFRSPSARCFIFLKGLFHNVIRHSQYQSDPVSGNTKHPQWTHTEVVLLHRVVTQQLVSWLQPSHFIMDQFQILLSPLKHRRIGSRLKNTLSDISVWSKVVDLQTDR